MLFLTISYNFKHNLPLMHVVQPGPCTPEGVSPTYVPQSFSNALYSKWVQPDLEVHKRPQSLMVFTLEDQFAVFPDTSKYVRVYPIGQPEMIKRVCYAFLHT